MELILVLPPRRDGDVVPKRAIESLVPFVTLFMLMTYDFPGKGENAPLWWVEDEVHYLTQLARVLFEH